MKANAKATHFGECQACGSTQKLPLGVLSQHGYEVQWHQFNGVCVGRGHLPYELSCELLPGLIEAAKIRRKRMKEAQAELRVPTTVNRVDYQFNLRKGRVIVFPEAARIETEWRSTVGGTPYLDFVAIAERDEHHEAVTSYLIHGETDAISLVNSLRLRQAEEIEPRIRMETVYIKWQERRLANWKLRPLREVVEVEQAEVAKKQKASADKKALRDQKLRDKVLRDGERAARLIGKYEKLVPADISL